MIQKPKRDKIVVPIIVALSIAVPVLVLILLNLPTRYNLLGLELGTFPLFHAVLNAATAVLLLVGYAMMRSGNIKMHRNVMITAFGLSCVFLVSYVLSKLSHDPVHYEGDGVLKYIYFFILITHILLSAIIVPLVLFTMYRGLTKEYEKHRKIARWTFPIWMYVAVTGVLVYVFMQPYY
jgi:putative membrane protein